MNCPTFPSEPSLVTAGLRTLFVSYDGLTDPLGRSQILPYLAGLSRCGHRIHVISCEKADRFERDEAAVRAICRDAGIEWHPLPYHRRPPVLSTIYDLGRITALATRLHDLLHFDLVHCRSYLPALVGRRLKRLFGVPYIFDMRGFWPEERTESGEWNLANPVFRAVYSFFKNAEADLFRDADGIVCLTRAAAQEVGRRGRTTGVAVIPCCVDFAHFLLATRDMRTRARATLGIDPDANVLGYLGSLGGNHLLDEMFEFYAEFRRSRPRTVFLFVTPTAEQFVAAAAERHGVSLEEIVVRSAGREDVSSLIAAADLGIAFKRAEYSSLGCSPTKIGEMLAEGIPVIANAGVGDVAEMLDDTGGGVAISSLTSSSYREALARLTEMSGGEKLRQAALRWFDLANGIEAYQSLYRSVANVRENDAMRESRARNPRIIEAT